MSSPSKAEAPDPLFTDPAVEARWRARFTAAQMSLPNWARDAPDRCVYSSNASGTWEIYAWDRATDIHRQVTDRPNGTRGATLTPDGELLWWFADTDGDEFGQWVAEPFAGRPASASPASTSPASTSPASTSPASTEPEPAVAGVPRGYPAGLDIGATMVAVGTSTDEGSTIWLAPGGGEARPVYQHAEDAGVGALSRDETLLAISHSEHGDSRHPAVRVLRCADGSTVADKWDDPGRGLEVLDFSPVAGDQRLLCSHERHGREQLLIWDPVADTEDELAIDLPGELTADFYPDGSALLVGHTFAGRSTLHRYNFDDAALSTLDTPKGTIAGAAVRPDGTVTYAWSSAAQPPSVRARYPDGTDRELLTAPGEPAPPSIPVFDVWVARPDGQVHVLAARPDLAPDQPLPTVFCLHGGPHAADKDSFSAARALWVEAGFAVVHVNYRGSTGYGSAWRDAIEGRPGLTELGDIAAVHDWAIQGGLADPEACIIEGWSWGGYLALLAAGTQPRRWAAAIAGVPVADYTAAYEDEMEPLRAFDRALFGGTPEERPELYRECSPISYVDEMRAPVLVLAGENDPRCPIRQVNNYLDALAAAGKEHSVLRYDAGHGSMVVAETMRHLVAEVAFAGRAIQNL